MGIHCTFYRRCLVSLLAAIGVAFCLWCGAGCRFRGLPVFVRTLVNTLTLCWMVACGSLCAIGMGRPALRPLYRMSCPSLRKVWGPSLWCSLVTLIGPCVTLVHANCPRLCPLASCFLPTLQWALSDRRGRLRAILRPYPCMLQRRVSPRSNRVVGVLITRMLLRRLWRASE